jgi:DNA modification methylase
VKVHYQDSRRKLYNGDSLEVLQSMEDSSVDCFVTSPPYWGLREYGEGNELGREETPDEYISRLCDMYDEVARVIKPSGTNWVNLGDTYYSGRKGGNRKSLAQVPAKFAIEMVNRGWILRNEIIWAKPVCIPSSAKDRFTADYEKLYFFTRNEEYHFNLLQEPVSEASIKMAESECGPSKSQNYGGLSHVNQNKWYNKIKEIYERGEVPTRTMRCVWTISYKPCHLEHTAVFPPDLPLRCIQAGCPVGGTVMDIFMGSGTTAEVAELAKCKWVGSELYEKNCEIIMERLKPYIQQKTLSDCGV